MLRTLLLTSFAALAPLALGDVTVKETGQTVRIEIDGQLFTEMRHADASHVYFYPLIGPGGAKMTRSWPMDEPGGEEKDHPHHRSLWFCHGLVNGVDFWTEPATHKGTPKIPLGKITHDKILEATSGKTGVLRTSQKWTAPDGTEPISSETTLRIQSGENPRVFDFDVTLKAGEKDVVFGDTKEGSMAIRIAESMRLKQPKGHGEGQGRIINSAGDTGTAAWGKRAAWVTMWGPVGGKTVGITMMDHPSNQRHPTRWHARDYGLFAANPFCEHEMDKTQPAGAGDLKLPAGKSTTFRYRIILHEGQGTGAEWFKTYASPAK